MRDLINAIPADVFWTAVIFWLLGGVTVWRFARYLESFRDAVRHAKHHWERAIDFYRYARNHVMGLLMTGALVTGVLAVIGTLAFLRATGGN